MPDKLTLDDVLVAKIQDDGTLGPFRVAGRTPSPVSSCTLATDGDRSFSFQADPGTGMVIALSAWSAVRPWLTA